MQEARTENLAFLMLTLLEPCKTQQPPNRTHHNGWQALVEAGEQLKHFCNEGHLYWGRTTKKCILFFHYFAWLS